MRKFTLFMTAFIILLTVACSRKTKSEVNPEQYIHQIDYKEGDSTLYGLACDGCTDSILIFLPYTGEDPDTFNIIEAMRNHQVYGMMTVGDQIAVLRNAEDSTVADKVINICRLKGTWCYLVEPKLKKIVGVTDEMVQEMLAKIPDSTKQRMMQPREYGFTLKSNHYARPLSTMYHNDQRSPVEFPHPKFYREWYIHNGDLILSQGYIDSIGHLQVTKHDTAQLVLLRLDSLVLRFNDKEQSYYRKP